MKITVTRIATTVVMSAVMSALLGAAGCTLLTPNPFAPLHPHWSDFSSPQARHYVNFPGRSKQSLKETKTPTGTASTYLRDLQVGDRYYGTAWTLVPGGTAAPSVQARILEVASAEALRINPGAKLISKQAVLNEGITGLAYVIDVPQSKTVLRQQIFMVSGVLVEQTYAGPSGTEFEREPGRFFDSLKLLP